MIYLIPPLADATAGDGGRRDGHRRSFVCAPDGASRSAVSETPAPVSLVMDCCLITDRTSGHGALRALTGSGVLVGTRQPRSCFVYGPFRVC